MAVATSIPTPKSGDLPPPLSLEGSNSKIHQRRALLRWTGFTKTSNLVLSLLTAGVFALFCSFHLLLLDRQGKWDTPLTDGERFWFSEGLRHWYNQIHLWSVIREASLVMLEVLLLTYKATGIFLPLQFLPMMRRRYISIHKIAGRLLFLLLMIGNISTHPAISHCC
jgi:hypothetical protein